jgi:hypothetical protein
MTKAKAAAKRFMDALKSGKLKCTLEPVIVDEKPFDEKEDYERFKKFSETPFYKRLLEDI